MKINLTLYSSDKLYNKLLKNNIVLAFYDEIVKI
jgi:hypothetical protein